MMVISDGEANVPLTSGVSPMKELAILASQIHQEKINCIFLDVAAELGKPSVMQPIARLMGATYRHLAELQPQQILELVHKAEE
jgi:Mg-chelatase subunit ChlD